MRVRLLQHAATIFYQGDAVAARHLLSKQSGPPIFRAAAAIAILLSLTTET